MESTLIEEEKKEVTEEGFIRRLHILKLLGNGGYGEVHLARLFDDTGPRYVAVKRDREFDDEGKKRKVDSLGLKREFEAMRDIGRHDSIIGYVEFARRYMENETIIYKSYLALEKASNNSLIDYLIEIKELGIRVDERWTRRWFK